MNENETQVFVIDDGVRAYEFKNKLNEVFGRLVFNPSDMGIIERYEAVIEKLNNIAIDNTDENSMQHTLIEASKTFKEGLNELLNRDVEADLFSVYSPITVMPSGDFYAEIIIDYVGKLLEKETGRRINKKLQKIQKYTKKYN